MDNITSTDLTIMLLNASSIDNSTFLNSTVYFPDTSDVDNATDLGSKLTTERLLKIFRKHKIPEFYGPYHVVNMQATCCFFALGLVTNCLNMVILLKCLNSLNYFLLALSFSDLLLLVVEFSHAVHYYSGFQLYPWYGFYVFFSATAFLESVFLHACAWLVVSIGIWRLLTILWPLRRQEYCSAYRAKIIISSIWILSILLASANFAYMTYETVEFADIVVYYETPRLTPDGVGEKLFAALSLLKGVIPLVLIAFFTFGLIFSLYRIRIQRKKAFNIQTNVAKSHRVTVMLTLLLLLYWISNAPENILYLLKLSSSNQLEEFDNKTAWIKFLSLSSNSTTFFLYFNLNVEFKKKFLEIVSPVTKALTAIFGRNCRFTKRLPGPNESLTSRATNSTGIGDSSKNSSLRDTEVTAASNPAGTERL